MGNPSFNRYFGYALIGALVLTLAGQGYAMFIQGAANPLLAEVIKDLIGALLAFRHANDIKAGNGASGVKPPDTPQ